MANEWRYVYWVTKLVNDLRRSRTPLAVVPRPSMAPTRGLELAMLVRAAQDRAPLALRSGA